MEDKLVLQGIVPANNVLLNDKLANNINEVLGKGLVKLQLHKQGAKHKVETPLVMQYDEGVEVKSRFPWTPYDRAVHDAVISLYEAGNRYFTAAMVYRCMNGIPSDTRVSPQAVGAVTKSLDKSRGIKLAINFTEAAKIYNRKINLCVQESQLLAADKIDVIAGGHEVRAYRILREPLLFEYNKVTGQLITIKANVLETPQIRASEEITVLKNYLIRQIEAIKKGRRNNHIRYDSVYTELGIEDPENRANRTKTYRIRTNIKNILEDWTSKKYIEDFKEYGSPMLEGVEIIAK